MTALDFLRATLRPGLAWCQTVPGWSIADDDRATVELLAIMGQESGWRDIEQRDGPARGPAQFEVEACTAVLDNPASVGMAHGACAALGVAPTGAAVYAALIADSRLAVAFARLLLWCDPHALPATFSSTEGWDCYVRTWRPGDEDLPRWEAVWAQARDAVLIPEGVID